VAPLTTRDNWLAFEPYVIIKREKDAPKQYTQGKCVKWRLGDLTLNKEDYGYYVDDHSRPTTLTQPVAFSNEHCCWVEIERKHYDKDGETKYYWHAYRPVHKNLGLDILLNDLPEKGRELPQAADPIEEAIEEITERAKSLHVSPIRLLQDEDQAMATETCTTALSSMTMDEGTSQSAFTNIRVEVPTFRPPDDESFLPRRPGGSSHGGGGGGGGDDGGGGGGHPGDPAGAIPAVPAPIPQGHQTDKFIGVAPQVFTGDRTTTEDFLIQWETYCGANSNNTALANPYRKAMIFLTYLQGNLVRTWVLSAMEWLRVRVEDRGWPRHDPRLWRGIEHTFRDSFVDTLEAE
jgi:hypothetical protein